MSVTKGIVDDGTTAKGVSVTSPRRKWLIVSVVAMAHIVPVAAWSQSPTPARPRSPDRRALDASELLRRFDRNRDGLLQRDEIPRRAWPQVERTARQRGLDPNRPLPVDALARAMRPRQADSREPGKPAPKETGTKPQDDSSPSEASQRNESSLVPGFGVPDARPPVPGFEVPLPGPSAPGTKPSEQGRGEKVAAASASSVDGRIRRYARSMLAQYDKNKNGRLEKNEWSRLRGSPKESDRNGDDILDLDELTNHLAAYGSRRVDVRSSRARSAGKSTYGSGNPGEAHRSLRFLTPQERLPKGIPDWFLRRDADLDGQISMAEFSTVWPSGKLKEFNDLDLNRDGLIVPNECLQATKDETRVGGGRGR